MSKRRREKNTKSPAAAVQTEKKFPVRAVAIAAVAALAVLVLLVNRPPEEAASDKGPAKSNGADAPAATQQPASKPDLQKLVGRWVRPDGGYVIQIEGVDDDGKLDAAYFNPNPIPVEKAEVKLVDAEWRTVVVLGANYAGSTYTLTYDPATDRLQGVYYQAVAQQQFVVFFERMN